MSAIQLARAQARVRVCLMSRLTSEEVEELEIIRVESADEIARLAARGGSCLLLHEASRAVIRLAEEAEVPGG